MGTLLEDRGGLTTTSFLMLHAGEEDTCGCRDTAVLGGFGHLSYLIAERTRFNYADCVSGMDQLIDRIPRH